MGVLLYCSIAVEIRLAALCFAPSPRATRALRATNHRPRELVALDFISRKPPKLRVWRCTQPRAAKATYSRRSRSWQTGIDTARCCLPVLHGAGESRPAAKSNSNDSQASVGAVVRYCCVVRGTGVWVCFVVG